MIKAIHQRLKWLVAGDELRRLERYRVACHEAYRWLGEMPTAANTAQWIRACGEDHPRSGIAAHREGLRQL